MSKNFLGSLYIDCTMLIIKNEDYILTKLNFEENSLWGKRSCKMQCWLLFCPGTQMSRSDLKSRHSSLWMKSPVWVIHTPHSIKDCTPNFYIAEARPFQENCLRFLNSLFLGRLYRMVTWTRCSARYLSLIEEIFFFFFKEEIPSRKLWCELREFSRSVCAVF